MQRIPKLKILIIVFTLATMLNLCPADSQESGGMIIIKGIHVEKTSENETRVAFELNSNHPPKTFVIEGEKPRIVCDFRDATLAKGIDSPIEIDDAFVKRIRIGIHQSPNPKVRIVVDLVDGSAISVKQIFYKQNNFYVIFIQPSL